MLNRRQMVSASFGGLFAFAARHGQPGLFARQPRGLAKRCLVLWMEGGPSQLETFDPKPGTANGGITEAIATSVEGLSISGFLPGIASRMHHLSVIRNLAGSEADHARARYFLQTGHPPVPAFPRPALGSLVSSETGPREFPGFVSIGAPGVGPAFLGPEHAPFSIDSPQNALALLQQMKSRQAQFRLLRELDEPFVRSHADERMLRRQGMIENIEKMVNTGFLEALDLQKAPSEDRDRYGGSRFGQGCLAARRLLQAGVGFVEIQQAGWDTHQNNFPAVRRLCGEIDGPWSALMDDLESSGMLADTLVVWMGEFGRTPVINARNGRDHFPQVTPVVLGGGPLRNGITVGSTSRDGSRIEGPSLRVADLFATILGTFGVPPDRSYTTGFDSPTRVTDGGIAIPELVS